MKTVLRKPTLEAIQEASDVLKQGGTVVFPTETVYGIGARADKKEAVQRIFIAKNRPSNNPLIVHIPDLDFARNWVDNIPKEAEILTSRFWPGPLTLILKRSSFIAAEAAAGLPTIGIRAPNHSVAQQLLKQCQLPIAAPSANPSTHISPTLAEHVEKNLFGKVDMILDGGPCEIGIESTILDLTRTPAVLLRYGSISLETLQEFMDIVSVQKKLDSQMIPRSPGQHRLHYAPKFRIILSDCKDSAELFFKTLQKNPHTYFLEMNSTIDHENVISFSSDPVFYAKHLYECLHSLEEKGCEILVVSKPPETSEWVPILDRLKRAAFLK